MSEPLAYLNGRLIPASQMTIPVWDTGFVQGVTVAEQLRTFRGQLFRLKDHLDRLAHSLECVGVDLGKRWDELRSQATELASANHRLLASDDDLGLSLFVTPGPYRSFAPPDAGGPIIGMHTYPVAFGGFADKYERGERLVISSIRQVPPTCWPASLKCRSRMHYYLADREARRVDGGARALLLDQTGHISEASSANFILFRRDTGFLSPPRENILPGVSVATVEELSRQFRVPFVYRPLTVDEVWEADEALLSSTSPCLLPVVSVNGRQVGSGQPGQMFQQTIAAWSQLVGVNIIEQAKRFTSRS